MSIVVVVSLLYVSLFLLLYFSYSSMGKNYSSGKEKSPSEVAGYKLVHGWIQYSSFIIGLLSLNVVHPLLFKIDIFWFQPLIGAAVSIAGAAIFLAAKSELGDSYSPCDDQYIPSKIVRTGIYSYIRHPIYLGTSLILWGFAVSSGSSWLAVNATLLSFFQIRSAQLEERTLATLSADYRAYLQEKA